MSQNPYLIVDELERRISSWAGSEYGVAVESGSAAIFLSLQWTKEKLGAIGEVTIPSNTYPSTACSIIHCGGKVRFEKKEWEGEYELWPLGIWDSALRFKKNMYHGGFQCLSFHIKKRLNVGRGGMILTDDKDAYEWLKRARFDGRTPVPLLQDDFTQLGWNMYLEPSAAARAIQLFEILRDKDLPDIPVKEQGYPDLSKYDIYKQ